MLGDPDRVKVWLLEDAGRAAQPAEILPLTRDPDDAVRIAAWNALNNWLAEKSGSVGEDLVAALRRCLKEDHDPVRLVAVLLFNNNNQALLGLPSARSLFVESLLDPVLTAPGQNWTQSWDVMRNGPSSNSNIDVPVPIDLMARVGNALGPYAHYEGLNQRLDGDQRHGAWADANKSSLATQAARGLAGRRIVGVAAASFRRRLVDLCWVATTRAPRTSRRSPRIRWRAVK